MGHPARDQGVNCSVNRPTLIVLETTGAASSMPRPIAVVHRDSCWSPMRGGELPAHPRAAAPTRLGDYNAFIVRRALPAGRYSSSNNVKALYTRYATTSPAVI